MYMGSSSLNLLKYFFIQYSFYFSGDVNFFLASLVALKNFHFLCLCFLLEDSRTAFIIFSCTCVPVGEM